jgi:hypothetical protein
MSMVEMLRSQPFLDSTPLVADAAALRARASETGYLFFRGLLPGGDVRRVSDVVLHEAWASGWFGSAEPTMRVPPNVEPIIEGSSEPWRRFYCNLYRCRELHVMNQHPRLLGALATLLAGEVLAHPRIIARVMFPNTQQFTTPPHQDFFHIGGAEDTWTAWVPLVDCPEELGGLAVVPGSHRWGLMPTRPADGAGGWGLEARDDWSWALGEFRVGDVLCFHSHTIHQGRSNLTTDRLRISCDFRYQRASHPVHSSSLLPHMGWLSWDEVYEKWPEGDPLRNYWERQALSILDRGGAKMRASTSANVARLTRGCTGVALEDAREMELVAKPSRDGHRRAELRFQRRRGIASVTLSKGLAEAETPFWIAGARS